MAIAKLATSKVRKPVKKLYTLGGGMRLHDARRLLGVRVIAHTGRVNSYARCMQGKIKGKTSSLEGAQKLMQENITTCGGVLGGKKRTK